VRHCDLPLCSGQFRFRGCRLFETRLGPDLDLAPPRYSIGLVAAKLTCSVMKAHTIWTTDSPSLGEIYSVSKLSFYLLFLFFFFFFFFFFFPPDCRLPSHDDGQVKRLTRTRVQTHNDGFSSRGFSARTRGDLYSLITCKICFPRGLVRTIRTPRSAVAE